MPRKISNALRDTVTTHPGVTEVHFTADGNHHFKTPVEIDGKRYISTKDIFSQIIDPMSGVAAKQETVGVPESEVVETIGRDAILKA